MEAERKERRAHPRVHLVAQVEAVMEGRSFLAVVRNVSAGGLLIYTANPAPPGSRLEIVFTLPERDAPIRARALVRHVIAGSSMDVQLEGLSAEDIAAIREFVLNSYRGKTKE